MFMTIRPWTVRLQRRSYKRRQPLILINGLAEQAETWFRNHRYWRRYFDVHMPNIVEYEGPALQRRIASGKSISVDYLVDQLHHYLDAFVQRPPYHLVASSMGGNVAVEYAVRYPNQVSRIALICPSGLAGKEHFPMIAGLRRGDLGALVRSIFFRVDRVDADLLRYYGRQFSNTHWRSSLLRTFRDTMDYCVRSRLAEMTQPTLVIGGREDRILEPKQLALAVRALPHGQFLQMPRCGHAPQIERAWLVNRLVVRFLTHPLSDFLGPTSPAFTETVRSSLSDPPAALTLLARDRRSNQRL